MGSPHSQIRHRRTLLTLGAACAGIVWGAIGMWAFPYNSLAPQPFLVFLLSSLAVGVASVLFSSTPAVVTFSVPILLSLVVQLAPESSMLPIAAGLPLSIFTGVLFILSRRLEAVAAADPDRNIRSLRQNSLPAKPRPRSTDSQLGAPKRPLSAGIIEAKLGEKRPSSLTAVSPIGIFQTDPAGRCTRANAYFQKITGLTLAESLGDGWHQSIHPEDRDTVFNQWTTLVGEGVEFSHDFRILTPAGSVRWVHARAKAMFSDERKLLGYVGTLEDITERREIEQLKDELISTISHELRTPLTSLRGFAALMLKRDFPPDKQREFLTIIHNESLRLTDLINDFLDIQRIESGSQTYDFGNIDLAPLLRETLAVLAPETEKYSLQLEVPAMLPQIWADVDRLRQVLVNLLSNAVKFSPHGGQVTLGVRLQGTEVVVYVADQGVGIPPEALPKLFNKFFRVDNTETRQIRGTGLGLALVKEIIEAHSGRVWVESILGQGSTFFFTLPTAKQSIRVKSPAA